MVLQLMTACRILCFGFQLWLAPLKASVGEYRPDDHIIRFQITINSTTFLRFLCPQTFTLAKTKSHFQQKENEPMHWWQNKNALLFKAHFLSSDRGFCNQYAWSGKLLPTFHSLSNKPVTLCTKMNRTNWNTNLFKSTNNYWDTM